MPKRRNPFGESSPLQLKTHVGQKELSDGVSGKEQLKAVYEKTRQLLFAGAQRNKAHGMMTDANDNNIVFPNLSPPQTLCMTTTTLPGQLCLDQTGQLTSAGPPQEQMLVDTMPALSPPQAMSSATLPGQLCLDQTGQLTATLPPQEQMDSDPCQPPQKSYNFFNMKGKGMLSKKNNPSRRSRCCFCEKFVDKDSIQQCYGCNGDFCQLCSTVNYDECFERTFCLNCSV